MIINSALYFNAHLFFNVLAAVFAGVLMVSPQVPRWMRFFFALIVVGAVVNVWGIATLKYLDIYPGEGLMTVGTVVVFGWFALRDIRAGIGKRRASDKEKKE